MKQGCNYSPYGFSDDMATNLRLTFGKMTRHMRMAVPGFKRFETRFQRRIAARRKVTREGRCWMRKSVRRLPWMMKCS